MVSNPQKSTFIGSGDINVGRSEVVWFGAFIKYNVKVAILLLASSQICAERTPISTKAPSTVGLSSKKDLFNSNRTPSSSIFSPSVS